MNMTTKTPTDKPKRTSKRTSKTAVAVSDPEPVSPSPVKDRVTDRDKATSQKVAKYYTLDRILSENADYNLIVGERGNGKTYAIQKYVIEQFLENGGQFFLLRRWVEDTKQANAQNFIDGNLLNKMSELSKGRFTSIIYRNSKYIAVSYDDKGKPIIDDANTVGYVWDVNEAERLKGQSFPNVTNIIYEEFISLSEKGYIPTEISFFLNIVSTIVRDRTNVRIWLLGNTVNPYNPFFNHFGIKGLELKQGDIWTKTDNRTGCKVAVEFCEKRRKSDLYGTSAKYYAFGTNDGTSDMILSGKWQTPNYPTKKFVQQQSIFKIAVIFDDKVMYLHVMRDNRSHYLFVQMVSNKTQLSKRMWVLDLKPNTQPNYYTCFDNLPVCEITKLIFELMNNNKVWFDDRLTGSYFNNFVSQSTPAVRRLSIGI